MAAEKDSLPTDDTGSTGKLLKIGAVVVVVAAVAYYMNAGSIQKPLDAEAKQKALEKKAEEQLTVDANNTAIDISAAFNRYDNDLVLLKDSNEKSEESIARLENTIEANDAATKQSITNLEMTMKKELGEITESFRSYSEINDSGYSMGGSNIELGGLQFESSNDDSKPSEENSKTTASSKINAKISESNYISLWDEDLTVKTQGAVDSGVGKVKDILSFGSNKSNESIEEEKEKENTLDVPGLSWVEAQMFHGLRCPIINGIATISGNTDEAPVTMKVRGRFHGPNGDIVDIGPVHIAGICSGIRTGDEDYGIAQISLKSLSYSIGGKTSIIKIEGYILDFENEDYLNQPGLRGPIDNVQATTLADSALAAALSLASFGFQSTQTATITNIANGTSGEIFEGNPLEQLLTQGMGGYFADMYDSFKSLKDTAVDAVLTKSGSKVRIFIQKPISVPIEPIVEDSFYNESSEESYL